jgi:hypothetical protein
MSTVSPLANEVARDRVTVSAEFTVVERVAPNTASVVTAAPAEASNVTV